MITYLVCDLKKKKHQVGSTQSLETGRPYAHFTDACPNKVLRNATRKRPQDFFVFISEDDGLDTRDEEQFYLDFYHGTPWCYNLSPHAEGGWGHVDNNGKVWANNGATQKMFFPEEIPEGWVLGKFPTNWSPTEEQRKKISERVSGNNNPFCRPEVIEIVRQSALERIAEHNAKLHEEKDEWGRSKHSVMMSNHPQIMCVVRETGEVLKFPSSKIASEQLGDIAASTIRANLQGRLTSAKYKFYREKDGI